MVAVAASPTPGAATAAPFAARPHNHPPYKDMILSALQALQSNRGTSRQAISKHISDNYSDLPPTHSSLLSLHLRRLQSRGVIRMFKHSYKLADAPAPDAGSKKRGRPRKNVLSFPSGVDHAPKRRGRPPKKAKGDDFVDAAAVYIIPQAEQLNSGFLRSLPGAVAIVLPEGLLSKKMAKNPVLILPNGVQSLVDGSAGRKKLGRPRKKAAEGELVAKRQGGLPRRKSMLPKQVLLSVGRKKVGRPRKVRENGDLKMFELGNLANAETGEGDSAMPEVVEGLENIGLQEVKKRLVGRPKKIVVVEAPKTPVTTDIAS